jgi:hypothetical protein
MPTHHNHTELSFPESYNLGDILSLSFDFGISTPIRSLISLNECHTLSSIYQAVFSAAQTQEMGDSVINDWVEVASSPHFEYDTSLICNECNDVVPSSSIVYEPNISNFIDNFLAEHLRLKSNGQTLSLSEQLGAFAYIMTLLGDKQFAEEGICERDNLNDYYFDPKSEGLILNYLSSAIGSAELSISNFNNLFSVSVVGYVAGFKVDEFVVTPETGVTGVRQCPEGNWSDFVGERSGDSKCHQGDESFIVLTDDIDSYLCGSLGYADEESGGKLADYQFQFLELSLKTSGELLGRIPVDFLRPCPSA